LDFVLSRPLASRRFILAVLKTVWERGLGLPWPITKSDIGKLPKVGRGFTPGETVIDQWTKAILKEEDTYLLMLWHLLANFGWRPSHIARLRWGHIKNDAEGKPSHIFIEGAKEDFKTLSDILIKLPKDFIIILEKWRTMHPDPRPDKLLLPWRRKSDGKIFVEDTRTEYTTEENGKPLKKEHIILSANNHERINQDFQYLRKVHGLPPLGPRDLRHYVATTLRKRGLSRVASCYWLGHDPTGAVMRDTYDNPQLEEILEEQGRLLPNGVLGKTVDVPSVTVIVGISGEALEVLKDYMEGTINTFELASKMESIRLQNKNTKVLTP
jgi:integrase